MRQLFSYLIDILLPPRPTERLVRVLTADTLLHLGADEPLPYHEPRVTALVWELKYHATPRARALAGAYLQETVLALCAEELGRPLLVPVPMHPTRRRARGHNQTETLCRALLPYVGKGADYLPEALKKIVDTPTQQGLTRAARMQNVAHSMVASPLLVKERVCIVVDDVTTTGATLEEAKRALLEGGACVVHTVALARS